MDELRPRNTNTGRLHVSCLAVTPLVGSLQLRTLSSRWKGWEWQSRSMLERPAPELALDDVAWCGLGTRSMEGNGL